MKVARPSLAPLFRSDTQGQLLAELFLAPDRSQSVTQLAEAVDTSISTALREIERADRAGILTTTKQGNTRLVRVRSDHPLHRPLAQLVLATYGAAAVVGEAFADLDGVDAVVIFGSWAARWDGETGPVPHDIDVMVLGTPDRDAVDDAAGAAEDRLLLPVQVTVRPMSIWASNDPFIATVRARPHLFVVGDEQVTP